MHRTILENSVVPPAHAQQVYLAGGTVGYPAQPRLIPQSVSLSVRVTFNYSVENLLILTIKATY